MPNLVCTQHHSQGPPDVSLFFFFFSFFFLLNLFGFIFLNVQIGNSTVIEVVSLHENTEKGPIHLLRTAMERLIKFDV